MSRRRSQLGRARPAAAAMGAAALTVSGVGAAVLAAETGPQDEAARQLDDSTASEAAPPCGSRTPASKPNELLDVDGTLFFTANDGVRGRELWESDGTDAGTTLVRNIDPGSSDYGHGTAYSLADVAGTVFFNAGDAVHGEELWKSDGTRAGTSMVKDIWPGRVGSRPYHLTDVAGRLFFVVNNGDRNQQLWTSDGTEAGTVRLKTLAPITSYTYNVTDLTAVGETLFFVADDGVHGQELWKSDGTRAGTVLVKDIDPSSDKFEYGPSGLTAVGNTLFFAHEDGVHGDELWKSDATEAGTVMVSDIRPGGESGSPSDPVAMGDTLFFSATDGTHGGELWRSDGTESGTVMVADRDRPTRDYGPSYLTGAEGRLFFVIDGRRRDRLWTSDGTAAGTVPLRTFDALKDDYGAQLAGVGGTLFFSAADGVHGFELWRSDGTEAGTALVKDIDPAGSDGYDRYGPSELTDVAGTLFFSAADGVHGYELWRSDGTEAGTHLVADINKGGRFAISARTAADPRRGTLSVQLRTRGAGELVVGPARGALIKETTKRLSSPGSTSVRVRPTARGMRKLERALRQARRDGDKVGKLRISARFTFTPCGGDPSGKVRRYTLKLR